MKLAALISRYLLGIMFTVFGLNGFLQFIHQSPLPNPLAMQFLVAVSVSHFAAFFFALQLGAGLLLLSGFYVPLALTILAAEIYNILAFHITLAPAAIGPGLLAAILWLFVFIPYRGNFQGIFAAKASDLGVALSERKGVPHGRLSSR